MPEVLRIGARSPRRWPQPRRAGHCPSRSQARQRDVDASGVKLLDFGLAKTLAPAGGSPTCARVADGRGPDGAGHVAWHGAVHVARAV